MRPIQKIILISLLLLLNRCITQFVPHTNEDKKLLVIEGLITDQPDTNTIKLSSSLPLGTRNVSNPVKGCIVTISDNLGNSFRLTETSAGNYDTDPSQFRGIIGRFYTLHVKTNATYNNLSYESSPVEMKPVPPIDSVYYEKVTLKEDTSGIPSQEGCQIYLNTHDPINQTKFYRWEYIETWEFQLPYNMASNKQCWISSNSDVINIKNTSILEEDRIERYPLIFISNQTDRLKVKYSILVKQYSLNEDEYQYWEKLQNISEKVGGLYDLIPSSIPSNISCIDDLNEKVLGYFSVSARSSKRIFIKDRFSGLIDLYTHCIGDTIFNGDPIPSLNTFAWIIEAGLIHPFTWSTGPGLIHQIFLPPIPYVIITNIQGCADCTVRGTKIEPEFWNEDK
ncbi:MAG: DUF4249 domain-containing protein [Bacteroidales bacterium]|jgi:hypothetical protein